MPLLGGDEVADGGQGVVEGPHRAGDRHQHVELAVVRHGVARPGVDEDGSEEREGVRPHDYV